MICLRGTKKIYTIPITYINYWRKITTQIKQNNLTKKVIWRITITMCKKLWDKNLNFCYNNTY